MKVSDLVEKLKGFEDFDVEVCISEYNGKSLNIKTYNVDDICDIGYSAKVVVLDGVAK